MSDDSDDEFEDGYQWCYTCPRCNGEGMIVVCVDDMCRACGDCRHENGMMVCPMCHGEEVCYDEPE